MKQETHQDEHNHDHGEMKKIDFILYGISVACFVLAFLPIPEIVSTILFGACVLLAGYDLLWNGIKGLFHLKFEEDTLMTIAAARCVEETAPAGRPNSSPNATRTAGAIWTTTRLVGS